MAVAVLPSQAADGFGDPTGPARAFGRPTAARKGVDLRGDGSVPSGHAYRSRPNDNAKLRDEAAALRDNAAELRDRAASLRDEAPALLEPRRGSLDAESVGRDGAADRRDGAADRRDGAADRRDAAADRRDCVAGLAGAGAEDGGAPYDEHARADRRAAAADRRAAALDRAASAEQRTAASQDRAASLSQRSSSASDRTRSAADRRAASEDRMMTPDHLQATSRDGLTGAYARGAGVIELERDFSRTRRGGQPFTVAFVEVDGLKQVNDRESHSAGDRVLRSVAGALREHFRSHDLVIRYGGDEFVCAASGITETDAAARMALVNKTLAGHPAGRRSVTVGLAELRAEDSVESLVARAVAALSEERARRTTATKAQEPSALRLRNARPVAVAGGPLSQMTRVDSLGVVPTF